MATKTDPLAGLTLKSTGGAGRPKSGLASEIETAFLAGQPNVILTCKGIGTTGETLKQGFLTSSVLTTFARRNKVGRPSVEEYADADGNVVKVRVIFAPK